MRCGNLPTAASLVMTAPSETPEDFADFLKVEPRLNGYVGGSSAERFPIETSVTTAARAFKAVELAIAH